MLPKLWKYYLRATLIPTLVALLAMTIWIAGERRWGWFSQIKGADPGGGDLNLTLLFVALINCTIYAALTTPLFLNAFQKVRNTPFVSLLAWIAFPLAWSVYVVNSIDDLDLETVLLLACNVLPFILVITWTFLRYRRALKAAGHNDTHAHPSAIRGA